MSDDNETIDRHALRNMLNNITMNAELVKLQLQQSMPADQVMVSVDKMLNQCKHCASYLNQHKTN